MGQIPLSQRLIPTIARLKVADAVDQPGGVQGKLVGGGGQQRIAVPLVAVADTGDVPGPFVAAAHLHTRAVEQSSPRRLQGVRLVHADRQRGFGVTEHKDSSQTDRHGLVESVSDLRL
jgi:hypothetical protein